METLEIARGSIAVCDEQVVVICDVRRDGKVQVRDLASGQTRIVPAAKLVARLDPSRERRADDLHNRLTRANPRQFRDAQHREACVVEALTAPGALVAAIASVATKHNVSQRTLWQWESTYRRWPSLESLLLDGRGVRERQRHLNQDTESLTLDRRPLFRDERRPVRHHPIDSPTHWHHPICPSRCSRSAGKSTVSSFMNVLDTTNQVPRNYLTLTSDKFSAFSE